MDTAYSATGFYAKPSLWQRLIFRIKRLRTKGEHGKNPPIPDGFKDVIVLHSKTHLGFGDRLRVLFGGVISIRSYIATDEIVKRHTALSSSTIIE